MAPGVAASATPPPTLADAARGGRWAEVREVVPDQAQLPAAVALVAARAALQLGDAGRALAALEHALPAAGALAPALRLEAGRAALALGRDPVPVLRPLLAPSAPGAQRRAVRELLHEAWWSMDASRLPRPSAALPRPLRRELEAALAVRGGDAVRAASLLRQGTGDAAAAEAAVFLARRGGLQGRLATLTAQTLLDSGAWREADALLAPLAEPATPSERALLAYLRGRAAYRLGDLSRAAACFDASLAASHEPPSRFAAAVQRARVAELAGDLEGALPFWDMARRAQSREVEGWDGALQTRAALGRGGEAAELLDHAPLPVVKVVGPRLAAVLLARGDPLSARRVLGRFAPGTPLVRLLLLAAERDDVVAARARAAALLADARAGALRDLALDLLPPAIDGTLPERIEARDVARVTALHGVAAARQAFLAALRADPQWSALCDGVVAEPAQWRGPAAELVAVGLEMDAAVLFADSFPSRSPAELAWSARRLAAWGNGPAALAAGERLWRTLGGVPASLIPDPLLPLVLPEELAASSTIAAREADVPPAWLAATIRRESRFDRRARSAAGALGVAQVVPETARRHGLAVEALWVPEHALPLAARELASLRDRLGADLVAVAAGYNAGPGVVESWRRRLGDCASASLLAAAIPYRETATYVAAVVEGAQLARYLR